MCWCVFDGVGELVEYGGACDSSVVSELGCTGGLVVVVMSSCCDMMLNCDTLVSLRCVGELLV